LSRDFGAVAFSLSEYDVLVVILDGKIYLGVIDYVSEMIVFGVGKGVE